MGFLSDDEVPAGFGELGSTGFGVGGAIDGDACVSGEDATVGGDAGLGVGGATDGDIDICGGDATPGGDAGFGDDWNTGAGFVTTGTGIFFDSAFGLLHHLRKRRLKSFSCSSPSGPWADILSCQFSLPPPAYNQNGAPVHSIKAELPAEEPEQRCPSLL